MSDTTFSSLESEIDKTTADTTELSENLAEDIIRVANGNVIANEHQVFLGTTALTTGYLYPHSRNVNTINLGPSAAGKSDAQEGMTKPLPSGDAYSATDTSSMGVLDDSRWGQALYAPLDEWQKIPDKLTEIIKSVSGGPDDEYRYVRSVSSDDDDSDGREGQEIRKAAKPYQFLYAQHALDHELSTRLLFLPVDDNVHIREAIVRKQAGHENIEVKGYDKEFIFDTSSTERALRQHFRGMPTVTETLGDEQNKRGGVDACLPPWVHYAVEPIFDMNTVETNRISGQVYNLIRAATVQNYHHRDSFTEQLDGHDIEVYVTEPQDVANVLSTRETLLATTHKLSKRKRAILDAIRAHTGMGEDTRGVTVKRIREYLEQSSSLAAPGKQKLRSILEELDDAFYITIHERAGPNNSHLYEFNSLRDIGQPRVRNLQSQMTEAQIDESLELDSDIDLDDPFADCVDPFEDRPFKKTVEQLRNEFADNPAQRAARTADLVADNNSDDESADEDDDESLTVSAAMGSDDDSGGSLGDYVDEGVELDGQLEQQVHERLAAHADGETFDADAGEADLLGIVDGDESVVETDLTGTWFDPEHDVWDQPDHPDDWVTTQSEAEAEVERAVTEVENAGAVEYEVKGDGSVAVSVVDPAQ